MYVFACGWSKVVVYIGTWRGVFRLGRVVVRAVFRVRCCLLFCGW